MCYNYIQVNRKERTVLNVHEMSAKGVAARRKKAAQRRCKVAKLKAKGMTGVKIAAELNEKPRTIYHDFKVLRQQSQ